MRQRVLVLDPIVHRMSTRLPTSSASMPLGIVIRPTIVLEAVPPVLLTNSSRPERFVEPPRTLNVISPRSALAIPLLVQQMCLYPMARPVEPMGNVKVGSVSRIEEVVSGKMKGASIDRVLSSVVESISVERTHIKSLPKRLVSPALRRESALTVRMFVARESARKDFARLRKEASYNQSSLCSGLRNVGRSQCQTTSTFSICVHTVA